MTECTQCFLVFKEDYTDFCLCGGKTEKIKGKHMKIETAEEIASLFGRAKKLKFQISAFKSGFYDKKVVMNSTVNTEVIDIPKGSPILPMLLGQLEDELLLIERKIDET